MQQFEMFPWKAGENRRRSRCCCASGSLDTVHTAPVSRASQMGTNIGFGMSQSRGVFSVAVGKTAGKVRDVGCAEDCV